MGPLNGISSVAASVGTQKATKEAQSVACFQGRVNLLIQSVALGTLRSGTNV